MNHVVHSIRNLVFMTFLLGVIYPVVVTLIGQAGFHHQANGSLIERNGKWVGSEKIAQKFETDRYFWPRPSAADFNPLASGGSNLGPTSADLKAAFDKRAKIVGADAPQELVFASASGLDPEIGLEAALYQIPRIAKARGLPEEAVRLLVSNALEKRQLGFLGEERINVLKLNLALDERK